MTNLGKCVCKNYLNALLSKFCTLRENLQINMQYCKANCANLTFQTYQCLALINGSKYIFNAKRRCFSLLLSLSQSLCFSATV